MIINSSAKKILIANLFYYHEEGNRMTTSIALISGTRSLCSSLRAKGLMTLKPEIKFVGSSFQPLSIEDNENNI